MASRLRSRRRAGQEHETNGSTVSALRLKILQLVEGATEGDGDASAGSGAGGAGADDLVGRAAGKLSLDAESLASLWDDAWDSGVVQDDIAETLTDIVGSAGGIRRLPLADRGGLSSRVASRVLHAAAAVAESTLTELDVSRCGFLDEDILGKLESTCTSLTSLRLDGVCHLPSSTIGRFASAFGGLKVLSLNWCQQLETHAVSTIGDSCSGLEELQMWQCKLVDDDTVAELATQCFQLRKLKLRGCKLVGDASLEAVAGFCDGLQELDLEGCGPVTDTGLRQLFAGCRDLQYLNVSLCKRVTDVAFADLPRSIRELHVAGTSITDETLDHIVGSQCPLECLNLRFCQRVTSRGLRPLLRSATQLTALIIEFCPNIGDDITVAAPASLRDARGVVGGSGAWKEFQREGSEDSKTDTAGSLLGPSLHGPVSVLGSRGALLSPAGLAGKPVRPKKLGALRTPGGSRQRTGGPDLLTTSLTKPPLLSRAFP